MHVVAAAATDRLTIVKTFPNISLEIPSHGRRHVTSVGEPWTSL